MNVRFGVGVGPEQFGVGAMIGGYGSEVEEPHPIAQEVIAQQAVEPECQPDIVQEVQPEKRKYTKRVK